jgi:mono/diheme cytochrome c family protein
MTRNSLLTIVLLALPARAAEPVDYTRELKPVLAKHCVSCHGPTKQSATLRLDSYEGIRKGGNSGPVFVPGQSKTSRLALAVSGGNKDVAKMPPKGAITADEIALIRRWIDEGAIGPAKEEVVAGGPRSTHWSFQPVRRPAVPEVKQRAWVRNPIDAFVLAELERRGIKPAPEAPPETLIRRLFLDLTGLPPGREVVELFVKGYAQDPEGTYEWAVDRLLESRHYGEMQARHWLDQARYADSNGFNIDAPRSIWKYRDWVIDAFNDDLPFDRFTIEQLAGDMLPRATREQRIATGFHRNTLINQEGGIDLEQFRVESIVDRVNTTGAVWLGVTIGCCQCHDHKFDPFSQREYYRLFAFFNNCDEPTLEIMKPEEEVLRKRVRAELAVVEKQLKRLDTTTPTAVRKWELSLTDETRPTVAPAILEVFAVAENGRNADQKKVLEDGYRLADQARHPAGALLGPWSAVAHAELLHWRTDLLARQRELKMREPIAIATMVMEERAQPRTTHIQLGGDFLRKGVVVSPGTPEVLPALAKNDPTRLDFARWLVDPANPLTPRVIVNRYWGQFFGAGIVETENDFGTQGTPPSHPELLDWLAGEFVRQKWSIKQTHKLIVMSAAYRQSSNARPELAIVDPRNRLLARQSRLRLPAENVRDVCLEASGLLNDAVGGPSVFPPQPEGVFRFTQIDKGWTPSAGADRYRRGLYTHFWRSAPHPALVVFDAPDSTTTCTRRSRSNTPLQALTLLNDAGFYEYAQAFARRLLTEADGDAERLTRGFQICLARKPSDREMKRLRAFLDEQRRDLARVPDEARSLLDAPLADVPIAEQAAWTMVARALLNLDEFITRE